MDVWNFILDHGSQFWSNGATHARLVGTALVLAVPVAVAVGVLASSRPRLAGVALAVAGVIITIPSFALQIEDAVRGIPRDLWELVRAMRASQSQMIRMLVIPSIIPEVLTAWKVNVGNATRVAVIAELVGGSLGVGYQLLMAQQVFNMAGAIAWTAVLVMALALIQSGLSVLDTYLLRWRPVHEAAA